MWLNIIIVMIFIGIVTSLGSALFYLGNDKGNSKRIVKALTVRMGLSVGLFLLLMLLIGFGVIQPHGLYPR